MVFLQRSVGKSRVCYSQTKPSYYLSLKYYKIEKMWSEQNGKLYKQFKFKDFKEAFDFMSKVADVAEANNHHPKWTNEYNKVQIWLSTHRAGDTVTDKDRELAKEIDRIYENA